ncbi:MAG: ECF transporter S component [Lachnospiraceae bacterium]|nr:ECF transporter S component [Lachnospiraceae bacterium]
MKSIKNIGLSAMFIAIGLILPFFTGQIQKIGNMLLPMHIPVFLCGLICGWKFGAVVGFVVPLMRSVIFGMPILMPNALAMAFELMTYGLVIGLIYGRFKKKNIFKTYIALVISMFAGRVVWAVAELVLLGIIGNRFTAQMFIAGAFLNAIPGIILQLILIPMIMHRINIEKVKVD